MKKKEKLFLNIWFPASYNLHYNALVEERYDNFMIVGRLANWNRKGQAKELLFSRWAIRHERINSDVVIYTVHKVIQN